MAIRVEREGIESCITKIKGAIDEMQTAANNIDKAMSELPTYWEGQAYTKAESTYQSEYQTLLTKTVPESVENFRAFIENCKKTIVEIDQQLSGS